MSFLWLTILVFVLSVGLTLGGGGKRMLPPDDDGGGGIGPGGLTQPEFLGRALFFDETLSQPDGQSCGSCHTPSASFADPDEWISSSEGAVAGRYGPRNSPTTTYADHSPYFRYDGAVGDFLGGQAWGGKYEKPTYSVKGALMNRLEMNNTKKHKVVMEVRQGESAELFRRVYGSDSLDEVERAFDYIADAIATYMNSKPMNRFSSKYDRYLRGRITALAPAEQRGLALFEGKGLCATCHPSGMQPDGKPPLFTTYRYYNIGIPKNPQNPFYGMPPAFNPDGANYVDIGLAETTGRSVDRGRFKVPSLRNIARTGPYMHNGVFATLQEVLDFHNTADLGGWAPPEIPEYSGRIGPMQTEGAPRQVPEPPDRGGAPVLGNLGLTQGEIDDLLAFLETLND